MTFSIVAGQGTAYGVAVASKFLAVGAVVPAATPGVGAVATQSFAKVSYKADSLALLRAGAEAPDALARLTAADSLRETRQVGIVGAHSQSTFTGAECLPSVSYTHLDVYKRQSCSPRWTQKCCRAWDHTPTSPRRPRIARPR